MITVETYILGYGPGGLTRDVRVTVRSDAGGIASIELRDRDGIPIGEALAANCARTKLFDVPGIPAGQFPIFVWADECADGQPSNQLRPHGPHDTGMGGGGGGGSVRPTCPPPEVGAPPSLPCVAALLEARRRRNQFIALCNRVHLLRSQSTGLITLSIALYALTALLSALATYCFVQAGVLASTPFTAWAAPVAIGVGVGLLVAAAGALAGAIAATVAAVNIGRQLATAERELETTAEQFRTAAMSIAQTCCPGDFLDVDVTLPTCH